MRNNLAHLLSASQLQEVQECHATNQIAVRRNSQNAEDLINDEKACRVHDTLMLPTVKGNFYNLYLVLFPLQVVIIFAILLQKMFTEEYTVESCESFMVIYNKSDQKPYYDCWVSGEPDLIVNHCSSNISIDDFTYYNIDCAQYYFQATMRTNDLTDDYPSCLTHVSRVTIQARTGVPGNNADITVYSQPPSSYTRGFRSLNESESA
ncbi:unnamed protein product [Rotaria socialis]|uniref:Uncharacterized protein n=1 Tax=Rotaria socialis TaxID=392032 RepID=A0A818WT17_9BILA|nr:unnamed protein product [Rotaria socialis]